MAATREHTSTKTGASGRLLIGSQGDSLASATTITITDSSHSVTGSTTITTINGGTAGQILELIKPNGATWALGTGGNVNLDSTYTPADDTSTRLYTSNGTTWYVTNANLNSPVLTGDPTAPTAARGDDDTSIATTEFVTRAVESDITTDYVHNGVDGTVLRRTVNSKEIIAIGTNALDDAGLSPSSWGSIGIGKNALTAATSGDNNVAIGTNALQSVVTGGNCVAVGANSLSLNTAANTTAIGSGALESNTTGAENTAVSIALANNTTGTSNTAIGLNAMNGNVTGDNNTVAGVRAYGEGDGDNNVAIGVEALFCNIAADQIVDGGFADPSKWTAGTGWAITGGVAAKNSDGTGTLTPYTAYIDYGVGATYVITYTVQNLTVGEVTVSFGGVSDTPRSADGTYAFNAVPTAYPHNDLTFTPTGGSANTSRFEIDNVSLTCISNKDAVGNTAVGVGALYMNSRSSPGTGQNNVAIGLGASRQQTTANDNVAVGVEALAYNGTGERNTAIGRAALLNGNAGSGNVAIGNFAGVDETGSNKLFIDNQDRTSEALGRTESLVYGVFDASTANQQFTVNGLLSSSIGKLGVKTAEFTSFCLQFWNDGGTLKHNIVADATGPVTSGYVSKITGASTTFATTPQVGGGVDFTSGVGVEGAGTSVVHFNTVAQVAGEWSGLATVEYNDSGTAMLARPAVRSIDINGTTHTRLVLRFSDPTAGTAVAITTATIGAGKILLVRFQGFVN